MANIASVKAFFAAENENTVKAYKNKQAKYRVSFVVPQACLLRL